MKSTSALPEGYHEICAIDLQKNKKLMTLVNGFALVIMALMTVQCTEDTEIHFKSPYKWVTGITVAAILVFAFFPREVENGEIKGYYDLHPKELQTELPVSVFPVLLHTVSKQQPFFHILL